MEKIMSLGNLIRVVIGSLAVFVLVGVSVPVSAHHSTAQFDSSRVIRIEGTITQFSYRNPHASISLEGTAEGAQDGAWTVGMTAANVLRNQGWGRSTVQPGDEVVMFVSPLRDPIALNDGSQGGLFVGIILADGSTLGSTDQDGQGSGEY